MSSFKDHFSKQSDIYSKYRPQYPRELYAYLAKLTPEHKLAWDCGTGNGQAASGLTEFYERVIATDPSEQQIRNAVPHPKIEYRVEKAEHTSLPDSSMDLLTIANALHWFDFEEFYKEVRRVLKKDGVIAAWSYRLPVISPEINPVVKDFHDHVVGPYWLAENDLVEDEYRNIPFPFEQIKAPEFYAEKIMSLPDLIQYFNTWSATQRFISDRNFNPTEELREKLGRVWNDGSEKKLSWKLILKIGRMEW